MILPSLQLETSGNLFNKIKYLPLHNLQLQAKIKAIGYRTGKCFPGSLKKIKKKQRRTIIRTQLLLFLGGTVFLQSLLNFLRSIVRWCDYRVWNELHYWRRWLSWGHRVMNFCFGPPGSIFSVVHIYVIIGISTINQPNHNCYDPSLFKFLYNFGNSLHIRPITYLFNWPLQPFSQEYRPIFTPPILCVLILSLSEGTYCSQKYLILYLILQHWLYT